MAQIEMEWVQQCEVCGCEHRHMECRKVDADVAPEAALDAFHARCLSWYRVHVDATLAQRALHDQPG